MKILISSRVKWSLVFIAILIFVYGIIFFFQKGNEKPGVVEIYFADRVTAAHKVLIDKYNMMMRGKVKVIPIDFPNFDFSTNERKEVLARSLRGMGDGIDLYAVDVVWVQRFAKWSEPLDKYFTEEEKKRILPQALASCYSGGELVATPLDLVQGVLYYREDLLKKVDNGDRIIEKIKNGITWEELIKLNSQINLNNPFYVFPAADYEGFMCSFMELLLSQEPDYFDKYGFTFDNPVAEKALQTIVDFIYKYKITPETVLKFTEIPSYQYYVKNNGLFLHGWPSYDKDFMESPFDTAKEKYLKKAPLPYFESGHPASIVGGWNLMVSKFSNKKKEVVDFIKFMLQDDSQEIFYYTSSYFPVINKIYNDPSYLKKYPQILEIKNLLKTCVHRPFHSEYTRYSKIMSNYFEQAMKKQIPVKEALIKATTAIQLERTAVKDF